jgi:hypothetical protein
MVNEQLSCVGHTIIMLVVGITMENTHTRTWSCPNMVGMLLVCSKLMSDSIGVVWDKQWERRVNALLFNSEVGCVTNGGHRNGCVKRIWSWKMSFHSGTDEIMISGQVDLCVRLGCNMKADFCWSVSSWNSK